MAAKKLLSVSSMCLLMIGNTQEKFLHIVIDGELLSDYQDAHKCPGSGLENNSCPPVTAANSSSERGSLIALQFLAEFFDVTYFFHLLLLFWFQQ